MIGAIVWISTVTACVTVLAYIEHHDLHRATWSQLLTHVRMRRDFPRARVRK